MVQKRVHFRTQASERPASCESTTHWPALIMGNERHRTDTTSRPIRWRIAPIVSRPQPRAEAYAWRCFPTRARREQGYPKKYENRGTIASDEHSSMGRRSSDSDDERTRVGATATRLSVAQPVARRAKCRQRVLLLASQATDERRYRARTATPVAYQSDRVYAGRGARHVGTAIAARRGPREGGKRGRSRGVGSLPRDCGIPGDTGIVGNERGRIGCEPNCRAQCRIGRKQRQPSSSSPARAPYDALLAGIRRLHAKPRLRRALNERPKA